MIMIRILLTKIQGLLHKSGKFGLNSDSLISLTPNSWLSTVQLNSLINHMKVIYFHASVNKKK